MWPPPTFATKADHRGAFRRCWVPFASSGTETRDRHWSDVLLFLDLGWSLSHDFRNSSLVADPSRDADLMAAITGLGISKLRTITSPDNHREDLVGISSVEIQKGGLAATALCKASADHFATNSLLLTDMVLCFSRSDRLLRYGKKSGEVNC